jgi:PAS domain S-box-containing protein
MGQNIETSTRYKSSNSPQPFGEVFWDIFHGNKVGIACTDNDGKILCSNEKFNDQVLTHHFHSNIPAFADFVINAARDTNAPGSFLLNRDLHLTRVPLTLTNHFATCVWMTGPDSAGASAVNTVLLKNLYRSFVNNTFEFLFRSSLTDELLFCNNLFASHFGFANHRKAIGFPVADLFAEQNDYGNIKQLLLKGLPVKHETVSFRTPNGQVLVCLVNANLRRDVAGSPIINWTVLDISKRIEFEESLKVKNKELEKVNATMEKFLYSTSHDLRSPISSILGLVNLMRLETPDKVLRDYIEKIEISAFRLDMIIRDLMGFTKTSYQRAKTRRVKMKEFVSSIVNRYAHEPNFSKILFEITAREKFPFYTDQERVEIILDNIVRNAFHFYDLNKAHSFVRITILVDATDAYIEILDNGIGIGKAHQSQIFNMFYKASTLSKGAGLGLYIVKESLHQLNGSVSVESEIGFGSLFKVRIPNHNKGRLICRKLGHYSKE